jgi:hypothetical protein
MSPQTELLLVSLSFAALANLVYRVLGRYGLVALAIAWVMGMAMYILASLPGPEVPLHDFERTPVPALAATVAGTLAATAFVWMMGRKRPAPVRVLVTAGVYLAVFTAVVIIVLLWYMS